ncbi:flavin reductase [Flaviflexus salsibiostraticola]|uniref:Flavin reductase n=1 Tax=Flaviflexus salsibiostraticola TaxID=1282737 RepID=A0A3Q8WT68_9ACTO|nr:flavin reductase family protein [Flaviflexus salsibiostraticola]AZN29748.1 flavin reductase [Flaviflexus salsibiostraticola]
MDRFVDQLRVRSEPRPLREPTERERLRTAFSRFPTGVCVVAFEAEGGPRGITVNSFTSVSFDPPLLLVSIQRSASSHDLLLDRPFSVNVLGSSQEDVAWHFAGRPNASPVWIEGAETPRLAGVLAWFECTPWAHYDGGDHTLVLGEIQSFSSRRGDPLGFNGSRFTEISETVLGREHLI